MSRGLVINKCITEMRVHGLLVNLLCSIVVVANTQTIPYLSFLGNNLSNHSYVNFSTVGNENDSIQCHTDLVTCCNSDQGMDRGDWFYPDAERVSNNSDSEPFYQHWANQSVDLRYRGVPAVPSIMGIYQCAIETIKVNNENNTARQVLYVGLYNSTGGEWLIRPHFRNCMMSTGSGHHMRCGVCTYVYQRRYFFIRGGIDSADTPVIRDTYVCNIIYGGVTHVIIVTRFLSCIYIIDTVFSIYTVPCSALHSFLTFLHHLVFTRG